MIRETVLIPKERTAVLIGSAGRTKRALEKQGGIRLRISKEGSVEIKGKEFEQVWIAQQIIEAIGRGFSPQVARKLFSDKFILDVITLRSFGAKSKKRRSTMKSRVIGTEGKVRRTIQKLAGIDMVIFGKTIALIGPSENVAAARKAIDIILSGSEQSSAYRFLSDRREE